MATTRLVHRHRLEPAGAWLRDVRQSRTGQAACHGVIASRPHQLPNTRQEQKIMKSSWLSVFMLMRWRNQRRRSRLEASPSVLLFAAAPHVNTKKDSEGHKAHEDSFDAFGWACGRAENDGILTEAMIPLRQAYPN